MIADSVSVCIVSYVFSGNIKDTVVLLDQKNKAPVLVCCSKVTNDNTNISGHRLRLSCGNGSAKHSSTATAYSESLPNSIDCHERGLIFNSHNIIKPKMSWIMHLMSAF